MTCRGVIQIKIRIVKFVISEHIEHIGITLVIATGDWNLVLEMKLDVREKNQ